MGLDVGLRMQDFTPSSGEPLYAKANAVQSENCRLLTQMGALGMSSSLAPKVMEAESPEYFLKLYLPGLTQGARASVIT